MKKRAQRWLSSLLSLVLVLGLLPAAAFAAETDDTQGKATYRWEPQDGALVSMPGYTPNELSAYSGSSISEDGTLSSYRAAFSAPLELSHDEEWYVEWEGSGNFSTSGMLLSKTYSAKGDATNKEDGNQFILGTATWISLGNYWYGTSAKNSRVTIAEAENTKYRLENRVETDENGNYLSNMVYWVINGDEENAVAAGSSNKNYQSGDDVVFNYIGATSYLMTNYTLKYLQVYDPSVPVHVCDYTIPGETAAGSNCAESGYTVMACECGATTNVSNGVYGDHVYGAWANVDGVARRDCELCDAYETANYVWQINSTDDALESIAAANNLTKVYGSVESGVLTNYCYAMAAPVTLTHDVEWVVEWKASGDWSGMLLSQTKSPTATGNQYFLRASGDAFSLGYYNTSGTAVNKWLTVAFDATQETVYRLENRVAEGGTNMVYLVIGDQEIALADETTTNYVSGTDLTFGYIGANNSTQRLKNMDLEYLMIDIPAADPETHTCDYTTEVEGTRVDATCMATGSVTMKCECGATTVVTLDVDPTNHTEQNTTLEGKVDATCGEDGYTGDTYCECGVKIADGTTVPATGEHSYTLQGELITAGTCQSEAVYQVKCSVCDDVSDTLTAIGEKDMTNHTSEEVDYQNVTETTHDAYHKCCGELIEAGAAHNYDVENQHLCACGTQEALFIITQPETVRVKGGEVAKVSVEVHGEGLKYAWYLKNSNGDGGWYKSLVKSSTYAIAMTNARADRQVYCVITDKYGNTVQSETVTLYREPTELKIITQPTDASAYLGELCRVTMQVQGDGLKYQWYLQNNNGNGDTAWYESAVQSKNYSVTMTNYRAGRNIYCVITDAYGNTVTTDTVTLTRLERDLEIVTQPTNGYAALGEMNTITMDVEGDGLKYQWYLSNEYQEPNPETWYASAVKSKNYSINMTRAKVGQYLFCVITDAYGNTVQTDVVQLLLTEGE